MEGSRAVRSLAQGCGGPSGGSENTEGRHVGDGGRCMCFDDVSGVNWALLRLEAGVVEVWSSREEAAGSLRQQLTVNGGAGLDQPSGPIGQPRTTTRAVP